MIQETISSNNAPVAVGPYSPAIRAGDFIYISGQLPIDPTTGQLVSDDIRVQTEQVLKNVGAILAEAGTDFDHVVKTTCFLSDINDFVPFNEVYATAFTSDFPARSAVEVARLPKDVKIEIEVIAEID